MVTIKTFFVISKGYKNMFSDFFKLPSVSPRSLLIAGIVLYAGHQLFAEASSDRPFMMRFDGNTSNYRVVELPCNASTFNCICNLLIQNVTSYLDMMFGSMNSFCEVLQASKGENFTFEDTFHCSCTEPVQYHYGPQ
jgi:hypothetical protein